VKGAILIMKILHILFMMIMIICQMAAYESPAFSRHLTEDTAKTYLGKPYVSYPLREISPSGFDCTTFVEEVLASRQENPDAVLNSIRYADGGVGFFSRNHFMDICIDYCILILSP
jgi:hypothetical protein